MRQPHEGTTVLLTKFQGALFNALADDRVVKVDDLLARFYPGRDRWTALKALRTNITYLRGRIACDGYEISWVPGDGYRLRRRRTT